MQHPKGQTFGDSVTSDVAAKNFRNQATGIGQSCAASRMTGAVRSQAVINAAPPAQRAVADRSYPSANGGATCIPIQQPGYDPTAGRNAITRLMSGQ